jgi:putative glutamine amidotransferase
MVGVQWHPEETAAEDPHQQALFDALITDARSTG